MTRLERCKLHLLEKQIEHIEKLLADNNVPIFVMLASSQGVPSNAAHVRLEWFLARRKALSTSELPHDLDDFIREWEGILAKPKSK